MRTTIRNIWYYTKDVCRSLHNFWKMRKVIWKYRSWDFHYGLILLLFYLEDFSEHTYTCRYHSDIKRNNLEKHIHNLTLVIEDRYCKAQWAAHNKRWGILRHKSGKKTKDGYRQLVLYRPKANTLAKRRQESREHRLIYNREEKARKQALLTLRRLLGRDIFSFWC